jgi:hypothetical protein
MPCTLMLGDCRVNYLHVHGVDMNVLYDSSEVVTLMCAKGVILAEAAGRTMTAGARGQPTEP